MDIDEVLERLIQREGGFSNLSTDRGGATKWGISLKFYRAEISKNATVDTIKNLKKEDAFQIYKDFFINRFFIKLIIKEAPELAENVIDISVNSGHFNSAKILQRALGVLDDGIFGENSIAALRVSDKKLTLAKLKLESIYFYNQIVKKDKSQLQFLVGWIDRRKKT